MKSKRIAHLVDTWKENWEEALDDLAELGYSGVENLIQLYERYSDQTELAQNVLEKYQLLLSGLWTEGEYRIQEMHDEIQTKCLRIASFLQSMRSPLLVLRYPERGIINTFREDFKIAALFLSDLGKYCQDMGVNVCILTHKDSQFIKEEEIDRLMNLVDEQTVFLCPDTGHLSLAEENPASIIKTYGECIKHVILRDIPEDEEESGLDFCALGKGIVDYKSIQKALRDISYQGWITVAHDESEPEPKETACESQYWLSHHFELGE